jgi:hypothetical protein
MRLPWVNIPLFLKGPDDSIAKIAFHQLPAPQSISNVCSCFFMGNLIPAINNYTYIKVLIPNN